MNLIEAIKSGKRFRRKSWTSPKNWLTEKGELNLNHCLELPIDAIIAGDWEVEQPPATITREQFDAAWSKLWPQDAYNDSLNSINCYTKLERDALAKELGL